MKTSFHRIYTPDGLELHGLLYEPEQTTKAVLLHVHGMAGNFYENKFVDALAKTVTDSGIAFCAFNNRGAEFFKDFVRLDQSSFARVGSAYEKFEDCVVDIKTYLDFLEERGFETMHLGGHSLGSPKVAYYAATTQDKRLKSVIFISPSDMLGLARMDQERFKKDIEEATRMKEQGQGDKFMSRWVWDEYPITAATYLNLFADNSNAAIFNFFNHSDSFETLGKIRIPAFAVMGKKDDALVIPIEETFAKLKTGLSSSSKVETVILGDATHGYRGHEQPLADAIGKWLISF